VSARSHIHMLFSWKLSSCTRSVSPVQMLVQRSTRVRLTFSSSSLPRAPPRISLSLYLSIVFPRPSSSTTSLHVTRILTRACVRVCWL